MAWYDLTPILAGSLDRHLILILLHSLEEHASEAYDKREVLVAKLDVLVKTNMIDYALEVLRDCQAAGVGAERLRAGHVSEEALQERREKILMALRTLRVEVAPILQAVEEAVVRAARQAQRAAVEQNGDAAGAEHAASEDQADEPTATTDLSLLSDADLQQLRRAHASITADTIEALYEYGKFQFDCGNYAEARDVLRLYRVLNSGAHAERILAAQWGTLACEILEEHWERALRELNALRELIDTPPVDMRGTLNPLQELQERTWLLHWGLFVFFRHPHGRNVLLDWVFPQYASTAPSSSPSSSTTTTGGAGHTERYLDVIETNCPHLLRYVIVAAVTVQRKQRRAMLRDLARVIEVSRDDLADDPLVALLRSMYVDFDLATAPTGLQQCEEAMRQDLFLRDLREPFLEHARQLVLETYGRLYECLDMQVLADKLYLPPEQAEKWVVDWIRTARVDAKIDDRTNQILMGHRAGSVYDQVVDATRSLLYRTTALGHAMDRDRVAATEAPRAHRGPVGRPPRGRGLYRGGSRGGGAAMRAAPGASANAPTAVASTGGSAAGR
ncbi:hypothetical protein CDCA_CDCA17G4386 [Cyanidium caldarium]|uniref:PCI domain-containing protein n=1 Tax=Cyanidium caldarium TaxID=2771 RepID=A0AAV9J249_CYACA|nr:hypothetical protein CDCA_CDCA17G4386 [Cyanidium caldarium]